MNSLQLQKHVKLRTGLVSPESRPENTSSVIQDDGRQCCHKHIHNPSEHCALAEFSVYSTTTGNTSNGDGDLGSGPSLKSSLCLKPLPCIASQKSLRADTNSCSITVRSPARKISMKQEIEAGDLVAIGPSAPGDYCNCVAVVTNVFKKHCTVIILDQTPCFAVGELSSNFHDIMFLSPHWRVGTEVIISGLGSSTSQHWMVLWELLFGLLNRRTLRSSKEAASKCHVKVQIVMQDDGWQRIDEFLNCDRYKHIHNPPEYCDLAQLSVPSTTTGSGSSSYGDAGLGSSPSLKSSPCTEVTISGLGSSTSQHWMVLWELLFCLLNGCTPCSSKEATSKCHVKVQTGDSTECLLVEPKYLTTCSTPICTKLDIDNLSRRRVLLSSTALVTSGRLRRVLPS